MPEQEGYRFFTVDEANDALPQLGILLEQVTDVAGAMSIVENNLQAMIRDSRSNGHSTSEFNIAAKRDELSKCANRIEELIDRIGQMGIILRDLDTGLVDFPAIRDGREIYLCWLKGEENVAFWHPIDSGYSSRKPL
jgi:hypothetical protein